MRLALLYALIDGHEAIDLAHLEAALALWDYDARSAAFVFDDSLGDSLAERIWQAISSREAGVTRTEIRDLFDRNKSKTEIDAALRLLQSTGRVDRVVLAGEGRPAEIWSPRPGSPTRR